MTGLGIIGLGAAIANYNKAKREYKQLEEQYDGLVGALTAMKENVKQYNEHKLDNPEQEIKWEDFEDKPNDMPIGLMISPMLRVANISGKLMYTKPSIVFANTSTNPYYLKMGQFDCSVLDTPVIPYKAGMDFLSAKEQTDIVEFDNVVEIGSGKVMELQFPKSITTLGDTMAELRDVVCEAGGAATLAGCPKVNIEGVMKADMLIRWTDDPDSKEYKTGWWIKFPGVLRYCKVGLS